jgi:hypothetical protein
MSRDTKPTLNASVIERHFAGYLNSFGHNLSQDEITFLKCAYCSGFSACLLVLADYDLLDDLSESSIVASLVRDLGDALPDLAN